MILTSCNVMNCEHQSIRQRKLSKMWFIKLLNARVSSDHCLFDKIVSCIKHCSSNHYESRSNHAVLFV